MAPVQPGTGLVMEVVFAVPPGSHAYWRQRLAENGVVIGDAETRFGEPVLPFRDPHGLALALVETSRQRPFVPWEQSDVPIEHQLRGMDAVRLWERNRADTTALLTGILGFTPLGEEQGWARFGLGSGVAGTFVELRELPEQRRGRWGTGGVHHVAYRVRDTDEQLALRERIAAAGLKPTPPIDRFWFTSVYFLEPGGVLFELATDGPGFDRDEEPGRLGERLILPPWLEGQRDSIQRALPTLVLPEA
jgi:glyoxalase family protein